MIQAKVRSRGQGDSHSYVHEIRKVENGQKITTKRQINAREYVHLLSQRDEGRKTLTKNRFTFIHENQCFVIDQFTNLEGEPTILRWEAKESENGAVQIPPFVKIAREVTSDKHY